MCLVRLGGGMDKTYYFKKGSDVGWLEFKEEKVKKTELAAYDQLKRTAVVEFLPKIDLEKAPPSKLKIAETDQQTFAPKCGYWVEHIPHTKTIKPKMCALMVMTPTKTILSNVDKNLIPTLKSGMERLGDAKVLMEIGEHCGEMSIAIHMTSGKPYLLDYSPDQNGKTGGSDLVVTAGKGLAKLLATLK